MPPIARRSIDEAVFSYFGMVGLDVHATRAHLAQLKQVRASQLEALVSSAQTEVIRSNERLARVRRAFQDGFVEPRDWKEQRPALEAERAAAAAEESRLLQELAAEQTDIVQRQATDHLLEVISQVHAEIESTVNGSSGIDAVRAALTRLFDGFILRLPGDWTSDERAHYPHLMLLDGSDCYLEPMVRPDVVSTVLLRRLGTDESEAADLICRGFLPEMRVLLQGVTNNDQTGLPIERLSPALFGPIPVRRIAPDA